MIKVIANIVKVYSINETLLAVFMYGNHFRSTRDTKLTIVKLNLAYMFNDVRH